MQHVSVRRMPSRLLGKTKEGDRVRAGIDLKQSCHYGLIKNDIFTDGVDAGKREFSIGKGQPEKMFV